MPEQPSSSSLQALLAKYPLDIDRIECCKRGKQRARRSSNKSPCIDNAHVASSTDSKTPSQEEGKRQSFRKRISHYQNLTALFVDTQSEIQNWRLHSDLLATLLLEAGEEVAQLTSRNEELERVIEQRPLWDISGSDSETVRRQQAELMQAKTALEVLLKQKETELVNARLQVAELQAKVSANLDQEMGKRDQISTAPSVGNGHDSELQSSIFASSDDDDQGFVLVPASSRCPSVGSAGHETGTCRPCAWSWRPEGCTKGEGCEFCHLCSEEVFNSRKAERTDAKRRMSRRARFHAKAKCIVEQGEVEAL